jgi:hypothetical protein
LKKKSGVPGHLYPISGNVLKLKRKVPALIIGVTSIFSTYSNLNEGSKNFTAMPG